MNFIIETVVNEAEPCNERKQYRLILSDKG